MTDEQIWIGQNGKKYGPYREANVRQWLREGKLATDALAWRDGMAEWVPVSRLFPDASMSPPPQAPTPPPFADKANNAPWGSEQDDRASLPRPPSLHWFLVWLFAALTLGVFTIIWSFIQANWVRKIDQNSNAQLMLGLAFTSLVVGYIAYFMGIVATLSHGGHASDSAMTGFGGLLMLAYWVLLLVAYFSMANSMRRELPAYGLQPEIGSVTLFFFTAFYLQGQMRWVARWKDTGLSTPHAPKGKFWLLFLLIPFILGIFAAICIPAYQDYVIRTQVSQGIVLADSAKRAVASYYNEHGQFPADNAAAGFAQSAAISNKYVSSVAIDNGSITLAFHTAASNYRIRDDVLVLTPSRDSNEAIVWQCGGAETSVSTKYLPLSCRQ